MRAPVGNGDEAIVLLSAVEAGVPEVQKALTEYFESVEQVGEFQCEYCRQWREPTPIYVVRGLKRPIAEIWGPLKNFVLSSIQILS